jgi:hypothetical protein
VAADGSGPDASTRFQQPMTHRIQTLNEEFESMTR